MSTTKGACALSNALGLASVGLRCFPCATSKAPASPHGFQDATINPDELLALWSKHPGPLVGVRTGIARGIDVLDIDVKHPEANDWWRDNRHRFPRTRAHRTRSGGLHLLFQHVDRVSCSAAKIALGVDTRATGGYVIWWPATGLPILWMRRPRRGQTGFSQTFAQRFGQRLLSLEFRTIILSAG